MMINSQEEVESGVKCRIMWRDRSREPDRNGRAERQNRINYTSSDYSRVRNNRDRTASDRRFYVSNTPNDFRCEDPKDLCGTGVGNVAHIELFINENDEARVCDIVEFKDSDLIKIVDQPRRNDNNEDFDDKWDKHGQLATARYDERVRDDRFMDPPRLQDGRQNMNAPAGGGGGDGGGGVSGSGDRIFGNTYGLCTQFLKCLGITGPLSTRVFVANLDYAVDEKKLLEVFRLAGKVQNVELAKDKDGKSRGFATVEYDHPVESVQAISMLHSQQLYDRRMTVKLDRAFEPNMPRKLPEGLKGIGMGLGAGGSRLVNVARIFSNIEANNPPVVNPFSDLASATGPFRAGLNNVVPAQLGIGGLFNSQASLASGQGYNSFAWQGLSNMDNDVGFGGNNACGGFNFSGTDFDCGFNRVDNDCVLGASCDFVGNQSQRRGGNGQNTHGSQSMSDTILVRNLPPNTTWKMLVDKFENIREMKFDEVREADTVMVRFASKWDAVRAVSMMNQTRIDDRTIDVSLY